MKRALVALLAVIPTAWAERIEAPAGWTRREVSDVEAAYTSGDGGALAVTRAAIPNPDAWRPTTRDAYAAEIERGVIAALPAGARRTARKLREVDGVPTLDLELQHSRGHTLVRVRLYRTYARSLAIELPRGASLVAARAAIAAFTGPAPPPAR